MSEEQLVSFDTDRIKDYVFATEKLREIRGASRLLNHLNDADRLKGLVHEIDTASDLVFFGGGSGAVIASSSEKAGEIIAAVEALYSRETITASISGVNIPLAPATRASGFGKRMEFAALRLRQVKDEKARRTLAGIEPYTQPCSSCERFPAVITSVVDERPVCASCNKKREVEQERKEKEASKQPRLPEELSELGKLGRPPGYIGFIYADGNNMGELLAKPNRVEDYKALANGLRELVSELVCNSNSIQHSLAKYPAQAGIQPYDELLVGGDDLMIVTAGHLALPAALEIAANFERESEGVLRRACLSNPKLTLSMAVVLAHATFPIAAFRRLAEQLIKKAKRRCAEEAYTTSALEFMVVTAAGSSDVKTLRDEALSQHAFAFDHGSREIRLTQRPYSLSEAQKLFEHLRKFRAQGFPRSQLQFLYEGLFHSQAEAIYRWGKVAGRNKEHRPLLEAFNEDFGDGPSGLPPWRRGKNPDDIDYTTALGDLIEIYPFVRD